jgi:transposase
MTIFRSKRGVFCDQSAVRNTPASTLTEAADQPIRNKDGSSRNEVSTSGIVSTCEGHKIALFFTGLPHAGENLEQVLLHRDEQRSAPIQMCDGLSRNLPSELQTILANCLTHARRKFVDEHLKFPDECAYVFAILEAVYTTDSQARKRCLSTDERLLLHQHESAPRMDDLLQWLKRQFAERLVEPNSGLGEAIRYMLKHWEPLTLLLRVAGAPLDNNICERALKRAILHRKNSLFYRTENGARVGDLYMSLIHTCQLNGVNPFNYLVTLQRENERVASHPEQWMPWNYKETLRKHGEVEMEVLSENPRSQTPRESLAKRRVRRLARRVLQATVKCQVSL